MHIVCFLLAYGCNKKEGTADCLLQGVEFCIIVKEASNIALILCRSAEYQVWQSRNAASPWAVIIHCSAAATRRQPHKGVFTIFWGDGSYAKLAETTQAGHREPAILTAHTLKSVRVNLRFLQLLTSASALTDFLRPESDAIPDSAAAALTDVTRDYSQTVSAIRAYLESER